MYKLYFIIISLLFCIQFNDANAQKFFHERGLAEMIEDAQNTGKLLALHRTMPRGTMLKVYNPANHKYTIVKVVGKLPDTGVNTKVIIKISPAAYDELNASGRRFSVEITKAPTVKKVTHEVVSGETLYSISKKYNVTVAQIKEWNKLEDDLLSKGQKLVIETK